MQIGAGFLIWSNQGRVLICRPTHQDFWSLPKGLQDGDESLLVTAIREVEEETGLVIPAGPYKCAGESSYNHHEKWVKFFEIKNLEEFEPFCSSYVTVSSGDTFPEVDLFMWATPEEAKHLLHYSQKHLVDGNHH